VREAGAVPPPPRGPRPARPRPVRPEPGSPAATITTGAGLLGLLVSLSHAWPIALFLCAVALAALPLAIGDRPHRTLLRRALLGGAAAVVGLVIVVVPLLFGADQKAAREPAAPRSTGLSVSVPPPSRGPV
jgi:hypothetical protein